MSCCDEFMTEENGVAEDRILCAMRLERIAAVWEYRRTVKYNEWATEYNRRIDELNKEAQQAHDFNEKYGIPWSKEVEALDQELDVLLKKWEAGEPVTPADWDAVTAGRERKAIHIIHQDLPKKNWPLPVRERFPNVIAFLLHDWDVRMQEYHEKQYAAAVENIVNGFTVTTESKEIQAHYKEQYREIVKHFAERGTETMELKRLAGDTSDGVGWQTPVTAEQIEQLREQLKTDQARFEKDVDDMLFYRLRYEDVMSQDFDVHVWVRKVFEEDGLSITDQAVQRAIQKVQKWVECWQSYPGGDADKCSAYRATPGFPQARSCYTPYYRAHLDDGREPDFDAKLDPSLDINYEDELFLPHEPNLDQFGMDLDNDTNYDGEFFLPFDT